MPLSFGEWTHIDNTIVVNGSEWNIFVLKPSQGNVEDCEYTHIMRATCERGARDAHLPNYFLQHCVAIIIRWIQGTLDFILERMGCRWYIPGYQKGILSCRETLWELGNWIKWKSKILPEYALCLVKFVSILKRCNHGSGCEILQRMWEFGVFYVNNQCLPWEPREGELCWSFIFSLAFTSPLMFIFFLKF